MGKVGFVMTPKDAVDSWFADGLVAEAKTLNPNRPSDCAGLAIIVMRRLRSSGVPSGPSGKEFNQSMRLTTRRLKEHEDPALRALGTNAHKLLGL